jgi:hypothetical protein
MSPQVENRAVDGGAPKSDHAESRRPAAEAPLPSVSLLGGRAAFRTDGDAA